MCAIHHAIYNGGIIITQPSVTQPIRDELDKSAARLGIVVAAIRLTRQSHGRVLEISIDKDGGITLDDCETFHKQAIPIVEKIDYDYLEVSSIGADRQLASEKDWQDAINHEIEIKLYRKIEGHGKKIVARLAEARDGFVCVVVEGGERLELPRSSIAAARLYVRPPS